MKKKLKFLIVILALLIIGVVAVVVISNRTKEIEVSTSDSSGIVLDLGEYKVSDYDSGRSNVDGFTQETTFSVESGSDFYNNIIFTSNYYNSDLDFTDSDYYAGYLICQGYVFSYSISNNEVELYSEMGSCYDSADTESKNYYFIGPIEPGMDIDYPEEYNYFDSYISVTFDEVLSLYSYIDTLLYKIEDNVIYLKGYTSCSIDDDGNIEYELSDDYLVKIYNSYNTIWVSPVSE